MCAVAFELAAALLVPLVQHRVGPIRSGLWSINWQLCWLALAIGGFLAFKGQGAKVAGASLAWGIVASRLGLFGFDLSVQSIVQEVSCVALPRGSTTDLRFL